MAEGLGRIRMDDGKKNAITPTAKADALVLVGRPGSFCAGFDLATMSSSDSGARSRRVRSSR